MITCKWDGKRVKRNCLPVEGTFVHPIMGEIKVVVNPDQRKVTMITTYGALVDSFTYPDIGKAITTNRLALLLTVRGLGQ